MDIRTLLSSPQTTRFAPSPTGFLHLGHAYAALVAHDLAAASGGRFLLRIEDIDHTRARSDFEEAIFEDLTWLGLRWDEPVARQSDHLDRFDEALDLLSVQGLLYPCFCTRKEISREIEAMGHAPHLVASGPEGPLYPGTCRGLSAAEQTARGAARSPALRLDSAAAAKRLTVPLCFEEWGHGPGGETGTQTVDPALFGDAVLGRKDIGVAYHLAVVVDDAAQGVSLVSRGEDLFAAAHIQRLLQALLKLPAPTYYHHRLIAGADGKRLAKRDEAQTLRAMRAAGETPATIRQRLNLPII